MNNKSEYKIEKFITIVDKTAGDRNYRYSNYLPTNPTTKVFYTVKKAYERVHTEFESRWFGASTSTTSVSVDWCKIAQFDTLKKAKDFVKAFQEFSPKVD